MQYWLYCTITSNILETQHSMKTLPIALYVPGEIITTISIRIESFHCIMFYFPLKCLIGQISPALTGFILSVQHFLYNCVSTCHQKPYLFKAGQHKVQWWHQMTSESCTMTSVSCTQHLCVYHPACRVITWYWRKINMQAKQRICCL